MESLPKRGVHSFVVICKTKPIGYIQYFFAAKIGVGWWNNEKPGTFGIDLMIGDASLVGHGSQIIQKFIDLIHSKEELITSFMIDPDPKNKRAIRTFQKAGFTIESEIQTPNGEATLMRLVP